MERVVYDELLRHAAPVLSPVQHGFLPGRSCNTNLSTYLHSAWRSMSDRCQMDAIYTDFSAAFQTVNHKLLLHKLSESYNIDGKILDWFVSYLSDREQRVIVNGKTSEWSKVKSEVPERALLFFFLYLSTICRRSWRRPIASCMQTMSKSTGKSLLQLTVNSFRAI